MNYEDRIKMLQAEIEDLTALLEGDGLMIAGSKGQMVLHPALAARRAAIETLRKLEASAPVESATDALDAFLADN